MPELNLFSVGDDGDTNKIRFVTRRKVQFFLLRTSFDKIWRRGWRMRIREEAFFRKILLKDKENGTIEHINILTYDWYFYVKKVRKKEKERIKEKK